MFRDFSIVGCNVFANSLMGITIQDGGKKERSNVCIIFPACVFILFYFILFYNQQFITWDMVVDH